jgi:hypothetical protein
VKIHSVPIEAYRQTAEISSRPSPAASQERPGVDRAGKPPTSARPADGARDAGGMTAPATSQIIGNVLSVEERGMLVKYFARFGDQQASTPIYGRDVQAQQTPVIGQKLDVRA